MRKDRSRLVVVGLFSLPESSATATEHARNARNRQLRSTRNRLRLRPVASFLPVQQPDFETLMVTDGERVAGNPTVVVGLGQTGPVTVMGPDREEISSWVIKKGGSQNVAARPY